MINKKTDHLFNLIGDIAPLNNKYKDLISNKRPGHEALLVMWNVGDIIETYINKHDIKPHALYWSIYGKSRGIRNSYITRDFLSYCLRIRKYFEVKSIIKKSFPNLQQYSLFREALPLLENKKYKRSRKETEELIKLLNSNNPPSYIKTSIVKMKKSIIGILNSRKQRLGEVVPLGKSFASVYNKLLKKNGEYSHFIKSKLQTTYIKRISESTSSLSQEGLYVPKLKINKIGNEEWDIFVDNLFTLTKSSIEDRNRFRKLFPPKKIIKLAEMIYAITTY